MTTAEYDSDGNVVNYVTHFNTKMVCNNSLAGVTIGDLIKRAEYDALSDSEKSEIADKSMEDFIGILEAKANPSAEDFAKLRSLFNKASKLAYEAGIEHERFDHICKTQYGGNFG